MSILSFHSANVPLNLDNMKVGYLDLRRNSRGSFDYISSAPGFDTVYMVEKYLAGELDYILIRTYQENVDGTSYRPDIYDMCIPYSINRRDEGQSTYAQLNITSNSIITDNSSDDITYIKLYDRDGANPVNINLRTGGLMLSPSVITRI